MRRGRRVRRAARPRWRGPRTTPSFCSYDCGRRAGIGATGVARREIVKFGGNRARIDLPASTNLKPNKAGVLHLQLETSRPTAYSGAVANGWTWALNADLSIARSHGSRKGRPNVRQSDAQGNAWRSAVAITLAAARHLPNERTSKQDGDDSAQHPKVGGRHKVVAHRSRTSSSSRPCRSNASPIAWSRSVVPTARASASIVTHERGVLRSLRGAGRSGRRSAAAKETAMGDSMSSENPTTHTIPLTHFDAPRAAANESKHQNPARSQP